MNVLESLGMAEAAVHRQDFFFIRQTSAPLLRPFSKLNQDHLDLTSLT